jgi:hypothetical protein
MIPLYPNVIAPLFNKFTALSPDSPVYPRIKSLATKLNFPLGQSFLFLLDLLMTLTKRRHCYQAKFGSLMAPKDQHIVMHTFTDYPS